MTDVNLLVNAMLTNSDEVIMLLGKLTHNNDITDTVRDSIRSLSLEDQKIITKRLEQILYDCYFDTTPELEKLSARELFYLKERLIYYIGRISKPDISLLKNIYSMEENKLLLLNIAFASLITGDEEIEADFISRISPGNDYDKLIRSWSMAFFANLDDPYSYIDTGKDDWSLAKQARLKRLAINDKNNPKFSKAKAFRWLDLVVIDLFLGNRGNDAMSSDDYKIVSDTNVELEGYSKNKVKQLKLLKTKINHHNPYL